MACDLRIGTSGYHYKHWLGPFYPPKTSAQKMLEYYVQHCDPLELNNLAASKPDLALAMNDKLNRLIDEEVGEDRGQMLPGGIDAGWEVSAETMAP